MERERSKTDHPREEVREKASGLTQKGALRLRTSKLLEEGEGDDLRVGEPLEGGIPLSSGIEVSVGIASISQNKTVSASSRRTNPAVCSEWLSDAPLVGKWLDGPRSTASTAQYTHLVCASV